MIEKNIPDFSIEQIANSGQCFRLNRTEEDHVWQLVAFGKLLKIKQIPGDEKVAFSCSNEEFADIWEDYFDLKRNYGDIKNAIIALKDPYLSAAVRYGYGLRMLKQDLWEMIITAITSQQNNISRIKQIIEKLCAPYGHQFPSSGTLAAHSEEFYRSLGFGYRAKYILNTARTVENGDLELSRLRQLPCRDAIKYLKTFPGIGEKVANCIALFGLHLVDAFPVDVWIKRIIDKRYHGRFDTSRFQSFAGIVQQYMFYYERNLSKISPREAGKFVNFENSSD